MKFSITVTYLNAGWLHFYVDLNGEQFFLTASYLDDALGNLAEATLRIAEGEKESFAVFAEEPGEHSWRLQKLDDGMMKVKILWFDEWKGIKQDDEKGKIILDFKISIVAFVRRIIACLSEVLSKYGLEGYQEKWQRNEFPLKEYNRLREQLSKLK